MYRTKLGKGIGNAVLSPYDCCVAYTGLKLHFSGKYDYFKYHGKVNVTQESFDTRRDKYFFNKLSKKKSAFNIILANVLEDSNIWVGDILTQNGEEIYSKWQARQESATYNFKTTVRSLDEQENGFYDQFKVVDGQYPPALNMYNQGYLSHENMLILNSIMKFILVWSRTLDDDIIWPKTVTKLKKYRPFLDFDVEVFSDILQKTIDT